MERELESKTQEIALKNQQFEARLQDENKKVTQAVTKIKDEEIKALESKMKDMKAQIDQILLDNTFRYFLDSTILTTFETKKMVATFLL